MPTHWTYSDFNRDSDLCQGDIISRTPELLSVLEVVHKHFCDEKYTAFMVLTQTCDLVRRKSQQCSARHVSLCVIRELDQVLPHLLSDVCGTEIPGVYTKESKFFAEQLLIRVINQNEQAKGLFYLHPDADAGIATSSVALLRISIALRREHYKVISDSRSGRVSPEFSAKLGWLTGNLYARVATPDWDEKEGANSSKHLAASLLESASDSNEQIWISEKWFQSARRADAKLAELNPETAFDTLKSYAPPDPIDIITERIDKFSREVVITEQAPKLRVQLLDDDDFIDTVVETILKVANSVIALKDIDLASLLRTDEKLRNNIANQVQSSFKRAGREHPEDLVNETCNSVGGLRGLLPPATITISNILDENKVNESDKVEFVNLLQQTELYNEESLKILRSKINNLHADGTLDRIQKVIGRLRNDQQVKSVLRAHAVPMQID